MAEITVLMTRSPSRTEPASVMTVVLALTDDGARWAVDAALPHLRQAALTGHDLWFSLD